MSDDRIRRILEQIQLKIFFCKNEYVAFLSSLVQTSKMIEDKEIDSPFATDGIDIHYNPEHLLNWNKDEVFGQYIRCLWHIARLHNIRGEGLDKDTWELACRYVVDMNLFNTKRNYGTRELKLKSPAYKTEFEGLTEEAIYSKLINEDKKPQFCMLLEPGEDKDAVNQLIKVQQAVQASLMQNAGDSNIADIEKLIDQFGQPKVNWQQELRQFLTDIGEPEDITWRKRNRRYPDIYMPSKDESSGRLAHLMYFIDVSGSVTQDDIDSFFTEVKAVQDQFNPIKLTVITFNHDIVDRFEFNEENPVRNLKINISGGTSYEPIHAILASERPTAGIIFTDLCCDPMEPVDCPVIWVIKDKNQEQDILTGRIVVMNKE